MVLFAALISLVCLPILPSISFGISTFFGFFWVKRNLTSRPFSAMFVMCFTALFLIGYFVFSLEFGTYFEKTSAEFSAQTQTTYQLLSLGFFYLLLILLDSFSLRTVPITAYQIRHETLQPYTYAVFATTLLSIATALFVADYGSIANILSSSRVNLGADRSILSLLGLYLAYFVTPLFFVFGVYLNTKRSSLIVLIFFGLVLYLSFLIFYVFRIRTFLVTGLFGVFVGYFLAMPDNRISVQRVISLKAILPSIAAILVLATITRFARGVFEADIQFEIDEQFFISILDSTFYGGDLGYHIMVMRIIDFVHSGELNVQGDSLIRLVLMFIPSKVLPWKPPDPQLVIGGLMKPGLIGHTVPPGIIGDAYINFGVLWMLYPFVLWLLFRRLDSCRSPVTIIFLASTFSTVFHFTRGAVSNSLLIFFLLYGGAITTQKLLGFRLMLRFPVSKLKLRGLN